MFSVFAVPPRNTTVSIHPSRHVKEGDNVTITCKTFSHPPAVIVLKRVGLANGVTICSKNGTFTLYRVTQGDAGVYVIRASNEVGDESGRIEISVMSRLKCMVPLTFHPDAPRPPPSLAPGNRTPNIFVILFMVNNSL